MIGTVIRLQKEYRDELKDECAIWTCIQGSKTDLDTVVTDICRYNRAAIFLSSRALMREPSFAKSLLDPHCDKCYLLLSSCIMFNSEVGKCAGVEPRSLAHSRSVTKGVTEHQANFITRENKEKACVLWGRKRQRGRGVGLMALICMCFKRVMK